MVYYNGQWGLVCDDYLHWKDYKGPEVACYQLGYGRKGVFKKPQAVGLTVDWFRFMPFWLDNVRCYGSESRIDQCRHHRYGKHNCLKSHAAGLDCNPGYSNGDLRLNGTQASEGRGLLMVYYNGQWGLVCDDYLHWKDYKGPEVACYQLGYGRKGVLKKPQAVGSPVNWFRFMPILLDNVKCNGSESRIDQCRHNPFGDHNCATAEAAGLDCNPENDGFTTPGPYRSRGPYRTRGANRTRGSYRTRRPYRTGGPYHTFTTTRGPYHTFTTTRGPYRTRGPYHKFTTTPGPYPNSKLNLTAQYILRNDVQRLNNAISDVINDLVVHMETGSGKRRD